MKNLDELFESVFYESHFKETTSRALFRDFNAIRRHLEDLPEGEGETLDLSRVVNIFINSGVKFESDNYSEISIQDFIKELIDMIDVFPNFNLTRLKTYLFYFFTILHKRNETYGITVDYLSNVLMYDTETKKLCHKNYMIADIIERQKEKPGEIREVRIRKHKIGYELALDKYLSDIMASNTKKVDYHLEKITLEELEKLKRNFRDCIVKIGANI